MKDDMQPTVRVQGGNGIVYYPRFIKNAKGEWELSDKSFQKLIDRQFGLEKSAEPSPQQKPDTSSGSEILTPSEIEQLRQEKKDDRAFFQKAFAHLKKQ